MNKGFTLIELLVVVLIVGILSAIAIPQFDTAIEKSRVSEALVISKALLDAQQRYLQANSEETSACTHTNVSDVDLGDSNNPMCNTDRTKDCWTTNDNPNQVRETPCESYITKNFVFELGNGSIVGYRRGQTPPMYRFTRYQDGSIACPDNQTDGSEEALATCKFINSFK